MARIHYKHPVFKYHACGMGDSLLVKMSNDLSQVTCRRCLKTVTGKKAMTENQPIKDDYESTPIEDMLKSLGIEGEDSVELTPEEIAEFYKSDKYRTPEYLAWFEKVDARLKLQALDAGYGQCAYKHQEGWEATMNRLYDEGKAPESVSISSFVFLD
jgi:hypothetical protein